MKILLNGANGKMCRAIESLLPKEDQVVASVTRNTLIDPQSIDADIGIDFSSAEGTENLLNLAEKIHLPLVIGTTGLSDFQQQKMKKTSEKIKILYASNFSVGVNVLFHLVKMMSQELPSIFQPEIIEIHHKHKKDAPSGTANRLLEIIQNNRKISSTKYGRHGTSAEERRDEEIGIHSLRCGEVVGTHEILFSGDGEELSITHRANNRKIFANGAILAAHWLYNLSTDSGLFSMDDVLKG